MGLIEELKAFVSERLNAVASEILVVIEDKVTAYEAQIARSMEENERNRSLLDVILKTKLPRAEEIGQPSVTAAEERPSLISEPCLDQDSQTTSVVHEIKGEEQQKKWKQDLRWVFTSLTDLLNFATSAPNGNCPFCIKTTKATETHLRIRHFLFAVHFTVDGTKKFIVPCMCKDRIQPIDRSHWHCPVCKKTILRRCAIEKHLRERHGIGIQQKFQVSEINQPSVTAVKKRSSLISEPCLDQENQTTSLVHENTGEKQQKKWRKESHPVVQNSNLLQNKDLQWVFTSLTDLLNFATSAPNGNCPFCIKTAKATETHLRIRHFLFAVHFTVDGTKKFIVPCMCKDRIQPIDRSHWHCPVCRKTILRRCAIEKHLRERHGIAIQQKFQVSEINQPSFTAAEKRPSLISEPCLDQENQTTSLVHENTGEKQQKKGRQESHPVMQNSNLLQNKGDQAQIDHPTKSTTAVAKRRPSNSRGTCVVRQTSSHFSELRQVFDSRAHFLKFATSAPNGNCPLCFKTTKANERHLRIRHLMIAVHFIMNGARKLIVPCACKDRIQVDGRGHWHCPFCTKSILRKCTFESHLHKQHGFTVLQKSQASESHPVILYSNLLQIKGDQIQKGIGQLGEQGLEADHGQYCISNNFSVASYIKVPSEVNSVKSHEGSPLLNLSTPPLDSQPSSGTDAKTESAEENQCTAEDGIEKGEKGEPSALKASQSEMKKLVKKTPLASSQNPRNPLSCKVCGQTFRYIYTLRTHVQVHTRDKVHICGFCGKHFESVESLVQHLQSHYTKNKCRICGKQFSNYSLLERHRRLHRRKGLADVS